MGYTELGRKRPIELQIDYYDKILVYQHQGEIWGVCYKHGEIDCVYNYTKNDFFWLEISDMSLKEIAHAQKVVYIHDKRILRNISPDTNITRFFPIHVRK